MRRRGQITLEIVVILLIVINIYAFISEPLGLVGKSAVSSIGTSALAARAVDSIIQKADMVGISGEGARDYLTVRIVEDFEDFSCGGNAATASFLIHDFTRVDNPNSFGVTPLGTRRQDMVEKTYSKSSDFNLDCENFALLSDDDANTACLTFESGGDEIRIIADYQCGWDAPVCPNGVREGDEECDTDGSVCASGVCLADCTCEPVPAPTPTYCGDDIQQDMNDDGEVEECDGPDNAACAGPCQPPAEPDKCTCKEFCGDDIQQDMNDDGEVEECDGSDDSACPGRCLSDCTCDSSPQPTPCTCNDCASCTEQLNSVACGAVTLIAPISTSATNCINVVGLNNKTFDCAGKRIDLSGANTKFLDMSSVTDSVVKNCNVFGTQESGQHGIDLFTCNNVTISNSKTDSLYMGIILTQSTDINLSNNEASLNAHAGIYLHESDRNTLSGNTANQNSRWGLYMFSSDNNRVDDNVFCDNIDSDVQRSPVEPHSNIGSGNTCGTQSGWAGICADPC